MLAGSLWSRSLPDCLSARHQSELLGRPTQVDEGPLATGGNANSRGPWASVAGQTVTITALRRAHTTYPAAQSVLAYGLSTFAEVASELRNLSSRSRKSPTKQNSHFGIQVM